MSDFYHPAVSHDERVACGRNMTDCEFVGISGGCGYKCPLFLCGECPSQDEMERSRELDKKII